MAAKGQEQEKEKEDAFQYRGYGAVQSYPKWFKALAWYEAQLYSTHADVMVDGAITRCEVGDWISRNSEGEISVVKEADYKA